MGRSGSLGLGSLALLTIGVIRLLVVVFGHTSSHPSRTYIVFGGLSGAGTATVGKPATLRFQIQNIGPAIPHLALAFDSLQQWKVTRVTSNGKQAPLRFSQSSDAPGPGWEFGPVPKGGEFKAVWHLVPVQAGHVDVAVSAYGDYDGAGSVPDTAALTAHWSIAVKAGKQVAGASRRGPQTILANVGTPENVALDARGSLYVADSYSGTVSKIGASGATLGHFAATDLSVPEGIALDKHGDVYVVDSSHDRIYVFSPLGRLMRSWGSRGTGAGQFTSPYGIAVDSHGAVYVSDQDANRIDKFSARGAFLTSWSGEGSHTGDSQGPEGLALDRRGNLLVADSFNRTIDTYSPSGKQLARWQNSDLFGVSGICVGKGGDVFVTVPSNVYHLSASGHTLADWQLPGDDVTVNRLINGIAMDARGNIFVSESRVDNRSGRVVELSPTGTPLRIYS